MRRVAVTGIGILSSIGNSYSEVTHSLRSGRSGVAAVPEWAELGLRCQVGGLLRGVDELRRAAAIPEAHLRGMSNAALYCVLAAGQAIRDAGLTSEHLGDRRTGCIVGSGISGTRAVYEGGVQLYAGKLRRVSPFVVLHTMASACSATLATLLGVGGRSYSMSSACATSAHTIGHSFELIRDGRLDIAIAGGGEELNSLVAGAFDAMRMVLSTHFNTSPERASRPFDRDRDGFVLAEGAGIVVLEEMERARSRGARIHGEIVGYAANSGGDDVVLPEADGRSAAECIREALDGAALQSRDVGYVNAHATSTVQGDLAEGRALKAVFGPHRPLVSSTKSMSGHALGAAGAHELIYCLAMMEHGFVAPSRNIESLDPAFSDLGIVTETAEQGTSVAISNSFGFGGTNAVVVVRRPEAD